MEIDLLVKLVGLVAAILALPKIFREFQESKRAKNKDQFSISKDLVEALQKNPHPLIIEAGYRALTGDGRAHAAEIVDLLSLPNPTNAMLLYAEARPFLDHSKNIGSPRFQFSKLYQRRSSRIGWSLVFFLLYFLTAFAAVSPGLFFKKLFPSAGFGTLAAVLFFMVAMLLLARFFINRVGALITASRFIDEHCKV